MAGLLLLPLLWLAQPSWAIADHWVRRYGGAKVAAWQVIPTSDCGWLVSQGVQEPDPGNPDNKIDCWLMKLDALGSIEWSRGFGTALRDFVHSASEAGDGGFVVSAYSESFGPLPGIPGGPWILKLDAAGNIEWQKSYENGSAGQTAGPTRDGCVLVTGTKDEDLWLIKLRPTGEEVWQEKIGGSGSEGGQDIKRTTDGGFILAGGTDSHNGNGNTDLWVVKLDPHGEIEWQRAYGGPLREGECRVAQAAGGGYVAAATIRLGPDDADLAMVRLDPAGEVLWQRRYDAPGRPGDHLRDIAGTVDGGAWAILEEEPLVPTDRPDMRLMKLDQNGDLAWLRDYGGVHQEVADAIADLGDGGVLMGGGSRSFSGDDSWEAWLLSLDADGLVGGDTCGLAWDVQPVEVPIDFVMTVTEAEVQETFVPRQDTNVVAYDVPITMIEQCSAPACLPLRCDGLEAFPDPVCEGTEVTLRLAVACGEGALGVGWDLDGDTVEDESGSEIQVMLPPGENRVTAIVTDSCADPGPRRCEVSTDVTVISSDPPGEVSGAGEPRLYVTRRGEGLQVEGDPDIVAYNVYSDAIGSWYAPGQTTGSVCGITDWSDAPGGRVEFDYQVPGLSWVVVTGSTPCAEGPAGPRSDGTERTALGDWERCGP